MATFPIDKNTWVYMRSGRDAAYPQQFRVSRKRDSDGVWHELGKPYFQSGEGMDFTPFSEVTTWEVECFNYNGGWVKSRESKSGEGTSLITVRFDDDGSGDGDFNDTIVYFSIGKRFPTETVGGIVPSETKQYPVFDGEGPVVNKPDKDFPRWTPKRKGDIEP